MKTRIGLLIIALSAVQAHAQTPPPAGRLLASNCFQCHGTDGSGGFERLSGMSAKEIVGEMKEMRSKTNPDIMAAHARGYTDAQLQLIGDYFAGLKNTSTSTRTPTPTPTSDQEEDNHDD